MKHMRQQVAAAVFIASLFVTASASAYSGAIYTSYGDGRTVNGNNYDNCEDVYLNGGPQGMSPAGLPDGEYYFQVTNPSGSVLLSDTPADERRVKVVDGRIYGRAVGLPSTGTVPDGFHKEGSLNTANNSIPVQLWHFDPTPNNGGVYKVWLIPVGDAVVDEDGIALIFDHNNAKTDNFRCAHDDEPQNPGFSIVVIFGHKYYDKNANGVYDGGEEWNSGDGRPPVTIDITWDGGSDTTTTDENGLWSYAFSVPNGDPAGSMQFGFTACEEIPAGYNQTGPLDGDTVTNADASATASGGCWSGTVTDLLGLSDLNFGNVNLVTIAGVKYYDKNANHTMDGGEVTIPGFKIVLEITYPDASMDTVELLTDSGGAWSYQLPVGSSVTVCEVMPSGTWVQTAPVTTCYAIEDIQEDTTDLNFGNVCLGPGGGHTLGFWSNKNGQATMNDGGSMASELALLVGLNLRSAGGSNFDPANYAAFRNWLLNATATNMAYMLSAQLSAMELNVEAGFVSGGSLVYNTCTGFVSVNDLMNQANTSLGSYGNTTTPHPERANQECLKTTLDDANNNLNFVQANPCDVVYPE